jgi:hypothetical protein
MGIPCALVEDLPRVSCIGCMRYTNTHQGVRRNAYWSLAAEGRCMRAERGRGAAEQVEQGRVREDVDLSAWSMCRAGRCAARKVTRTRRCSPTSARMMERGWWLCPHSLLSARSVETALGPRLRIRSRLASVAGFRGGCVWGQVWWRFARRSDL